MPPNKFDYEREIGKLIAADLDSCCNLEFETIWNAGIDVEYEDPSGFDYRIERIENKAKRVKWLQISLNGYPCYLLERYDRHDGAAYHFKSYTWEPKNLYDVDDDSYRAHQSQFDIFLSWIREEATVADFCMVRRKAEPGPVMYSMQSLNNNFALGFGFASVDALRECFENVVKQRL